jgi:hypothetical protein
VPREKRGQRRRASLCHTGARGKEEKRVPKGTDRTMSFKAKPHQRAVTNSCGEVPPPALVELASHRLFTGHLLRFRISNREIPRLETYLTPAESTLPMALIAKKLEVRKSAFVPPGGAGASNSTISRNVIPSANPAITQGPEGAPL